MLESLSGRRMEKNKEGKQVEKNILSSVIFS
jgi:hypothetical protein